MLVAGLGFDGWDGIVGQRRKRFGSSAPSPHTRPTDLSIDVASQLPKKLR